ncbi:MAG TPA: succinylglutamate desuccinylase/aspartoacylase family protein, partial [Thermoanaerobaculia bacterium]|nr:succinylglutamate desuccinylase/aspartoacylase family protein [Thermoanaerobaculia bacterium]
MLDTAIRPAATETAAAAPPRRLGDHEGSRPGPTVVAIGAMHGNEPAGAAAIRAVLERLRAERLPLAGRFVGLVGNRRALAVGSRFLDRDLNRRWSEAALDELAAA